MRNVVLKLGLLQDALTIYQDEMDRCRTNGAYWALLHITVCLPDICAALQSPNGKTTRQLYENWCDLYLPNALLLGKERYRMRCKVLHQGRATTDQPSSRYIGFSFGQPSPAGHVDHLRVDARCLNVDVGRLADETQNGVVQWAKSVEAKPRSDDAMHVFKNLSSLVRVRQLPFPISAPAGIPGMSQFATTLKTS